MIVLVRTLTTPRAGLPGESNPARYEPLEWPITVEPVPERAPAREPEPVPEKAPEREPEKVPA
jgi:hypothetical protein